MSELTVAIDANKLKELKSRESDLKLLIDAKDLLNEMEYDTDNINEAKKQLQYAIESERKLITNIISDTYLDSLNKE
jgi:vacuolar-type H+-ATPase subunit I/STV1